jgi:Zn-dependent M16 (insulinase) family peptidase
VLIDSTFGDFSVSPFRSLAAQGLMVNANWLVDRRTVADASDLLVHVLTDTKTTDTAAASTILRQANESAQESLVGSGHRYAMSLARAALPNAHAVDTAAERWGGLTQMRMLQRLAEADDASLAPQAVALARSLMVPSLASRLVGPTEASVLDTAVTLESALTAGLAGLADAARADLQLDSGVLALAHEELRLPETRHALLVRHELPVNYVARAIQAVPYSHPDYAALKVASKVLNVRLHALIREQGGAYGAGSSLAQSGSFAYFSYRDPSSTATLDAFTRATQDYAAGGAFTDRDLHEAKLSLFAEVDAPQPTSAKGSFTFATGLTHDDLVSFRARVFDVTRDDIRRVSAQYLAEPKEVTNVIIGTVDEGEESWNLV